MSKIALKVRIYPTEEQISFMENQFGAVRFVYNKALFLKKHHYKYHNTNLNLINDVKPLLSIAKRSRKYSWLKQFDSLSLQQSIRNLNNSFDRFFSKKNKFPQYKKKNKKQTSYHTGKNISVNYELSSIRIPKIGNIKAILHRHLLGDLKSITLSKTSSGKFFASILFEQENKNIEKIKNIKESKILGIDLGLKHFIIDSNFVKIENPHFLINEEKNLRRKQKQLSRKIKGSKNRGKARLIVAKVHEKVVNKRTDFFYKLAKQIIDENQAIVVESLKIKNLVKNRSLSKRISEASWGDFITILKRKTEEAGKVFVEIDSFFPSTKLCSCCGYKNNKLTLNNRVWNCPCCSAIHDRDENAATNIKQEGKRKIIAAGQVVTAC